MKNSNIVLAPPIQPTDERTRLTMTPAEFGFVHHEAGPKLDVANMKLPSFYEGLAKGELFTELMVTDQGNPVILTSLIGKHPKLSKIAGAIESKQSNTQEFSEEIQGIFLKGVKSLVDQGNTGVKNVRGTTDTIYYGGNVGVNNGRLLRAYFSPVGEYADIPVFAKVAACRTKEAESKVYRSFGLRLGKKS